MGIYVKENWSQIIIFIAKPKQSKLFRVCMKAVHHSLSYKTFERRGCICLRARGSGKELLQFQVLFKYHGGLVII